jgi:hypothetical protein
MDAYSIWNPLVWILFIALNAAIVLSVKLFHRRLPHFPEGNPSMDTKMKVRDVMIYSTETLNHLHTTVDADQSVEDLYSIFLKYSEEWFAVKDQQRIVGKISLNEVLGLKVNEWDKSRAEVSLEESIRHV